jgi:SAM-dependent methyltransferase
VAGQLRRALKIFAEAYSECVENPIDLLNNGDAAGESAYLDNARMSYERTLRDVVELVAGRLEVATPVRILEIGAYLGVVSLTLARLGCRVTALDLPEFMANSRLQKRFADNGVQRVAVNLREYPLPLEDEAYDLVIMCETLEHLNFNPLPVLTEVSRTLVKGGYLYLALPNLAALPHRVGLLLGHSIHNPVSDFRAQLSPDGNMIVGIHWREYTKAELLELLTLSGFTCERHSYLDAARSSAPAWLLYRGFPSLRPYQVAVAKKSGAGYAGFHFYRATRP